MPVDPQIKPMLDLINQGGVSIAAMEPQAVRQLFATMAAGQPEVAVAHVEDRPVPTDDGGVWVRIYTPEAAVRPCPALVWFHGGGWVIGSVDESDGTARRLANSTGAVVISVEYRLAPEAPYPAGPDDAMAAFRWVVANADELGIDPERVAVGGDSAGGNLAALVALRCRDELLPLRFQLLVYPATDLTGSHPSIDENGEGYLLTKDAMVWFVDHYLGDLDPKDPWVSPLHADDLSHVAPALVYTAEFDPLRDEGEAYAQRLKEAGVTVEVERWDSQIHGFFGLHGLLEISDIAVTKAGAAVRDALA